MDVKNILTGISVVIVIILISAGAFMYLKFMTTSEIKALVIPEQGVVEVDFGKGFELIQTETKVAKGDIIKTGDNSQAIVVLFESVIIDLDPNTEISLDEIAKDNILVTQKTGSTWNKFTKLNGIESYEIKTPNSVATVRGTEFGFEEDTVIVAEGNVTLESGNNKISITNGEKAGLVDGKLEMQELTQQEKQKLINKLKKQIKNLKQVRELELRKHKDTIKLLEDQYGEGKYTAKDFINASDTGKIIVEDLINQSPIKTKPVVKLKDVSVSVRKQIELLEEYEGKFNLTARWTLKTSN